MKTWTLLGREESVLQERSSMTVAFDRQPAETAEHVPARAGIAKIGSRLAAQWPKAAIGFGFVLTVVWVILLGWGVVHLFRLW